MNTALLSQHRERVLLAAVFGFFLLSVILLLLGWEGAKTYEDPRMTMDVPSLLNLVFRVNEVHARFDSVWKEGDSKRTNPMGPPGRGVGVSLVETGQLKPPPIALPPPAMLPPDPSPELIPLGSALQHRDLYISPPQKFETAKLNQNGKCEFEVRTSDRIWLKGRREPREGEIVELSEKQGYVTFRDGKTRIQFQYKIPDEVEKWDFKIDQEGSYKLLSEGAGKIAEEHLKLVFECGDCGMEKEAREELDTVLKLDPRIEKAWLTKVAFAQKDKDFDGEMAVLTEAKAALKTSVPILTRRAEHLLVLEMPELALEDYQQAFEGTTNLKLAEIIAGAQREQWAAIPSDAMGLLTRIAEIKFLLDELDHAALIADTVLHADAASAAAANLRGLIYLLRGDSKQAQDLLSKAAQSGSVESLNNAAGLLIVLRDFQNAESALTAALKLAPNHPKAHYNLALVRIAQKRLDEAAKELAAALAARPDYVLPLVAQATVAQLKRDRGTAQQMRQRLKQIADSNPYLHYLEALALLEDKDSKNGLVEAQNADMLLPGKKEFQRALICAAISTPGRLAEAQQLLAPLLVPEQNPDVIDYNLLGALKLALGDRAEAEKAFRQALDLSKNTDQVAAASLGYLAWVAQPRRPEEARNYFDLAAQIGGLVTDYVVASRNIVSQVAGELLGPQDTFNRPTPEEPTVGVPWLEDERDGVTMKVQNNQLVFEGKRQTAPGWNTLLRPLNDPLFKRIEGTIDRKPENAAVVGVTIRRGNGGLCLGIRGNQLVWSPAAQARWEPLQNVPAQPVRLSIEVVDRDNGIFRFLLNGAVVATPAPVRAPELAKEGSYDVGFFSYGELNQTVKFSSSGFSVIVRARQQ